MNAPHPLQPTMLTPQPAPAEDDEGINLVEYWDIIVDNRWLIAAILCVAVAAGTCYALLARPIYESNLLVQVEDNSPNGKSLLGDAAALLDTKTPTAAEIEILRSRLVIGHAVDNAKLFIDAHPRYLPIVGAALARRADGLSTPGFLGLPGYVTGKEAITVSRFDVPRSLEGSAFTLTAGTSDGESVK